LTHSTVIFWRRWYRFELRLLRADS